VKEKNKSHDVRREEEDDDKISTNRDQSTNEDNINKESIMLEVKRINYNMTLV
jgi:hypothetical protein